MHAPLTKEDIVRLVPDLVLLEAEQMTWDQVGHLLNEDLQAVRHLHSVDHEQGVTAAVENPWKLVKKEIFLFGATGDPAYDPLREEVQRNRDAGPAYLMNLFSAWLAIKTGFPTGVIRPMAAAVLWGLTEPGSSGWADLEISTEFEEVGGR